MIDHIGLDVTNIARSKAFYAAALAPLGYRVVAEETDGGSTVVMFGVEGPEFVIADKDRPGEANHVAFRADTRDQVDNFHAAAVAAGGRDNGPPASANATARTITPPSCSTRTASTSRRFAMRRRRSTIDPKKLDVDVNVGFLAGTLRIRPYWRRTHG